MTNEQRMLELAARCEAATGPDRELDAEIAAAVHMKQITYQSPEWIKDPEFTASLDAAMTLVPKGAIFRVQNTHGGYGYVEVAGAKFFEAGAATPALALCAAALRARASLKAQSTDTSEGQKI